MRKYDKEWRGRELTGITHVENTEKTRYAWKRLVLNIYAQAVDDKLKLEGKPSEHWLMPMSNEDKDMKIIDDFLEFKTDISKFYLNFINAYNSVGESQTDEHLVV